MLIVLKKDATSADIDRICEKIKSQGWTPHIIPGAMRTAIGITGNPTAVDPQLFEGMPGILETIRVTKPFKLVSREVKPEDTIIHYKDVHIGAPYFVLMAGPCSVESREQIFEIAEIVSNLGIKILRGGAYKPRTSPYSFQGLGEKGLAYMREAADKYNLFTITEAIDEQSLAAVNEYSDFIQIGARNMQNFSLLKKIGQLQKPVLLKRGMSATIDEFLMSSEYIYTNGNKNIILCERGIRTFVNHSRNTLDLNIVPAIKELSHLPIIVDPSHGTGKRYMVEPLSYAAMAVGADGLIIEVHNNPDKALSDGVQSILPSQMQNILNTLKQLAEVFRRKIV